MMTDDDIDFSALRSWDDLQRAGEVAPPPNEVIIRAQHAVSAAARNELAHRVVALRSRRRRRVVLATSVAAAAVGAFSLLPGGAARPVDAHAQAVTVLRAASRVAAAAPDAELQPGQRLYVKLTVTSPTVIEPTPGNVTARYISTVDSEFWWAADGTATIRRHRVGDISFPTEKDRLGYQAAGFTADEVAAPQVDKVQASPDCLALPTYTCSRQLPTDPAALEAYLRSRTAGRGHSDDQELWTVVNDLLRFPVTPAPLRASLYEVATRIPGVRSLGQATDSSGRTGVAIAYDYALTTSPSPQGHDVMIVDPSTGQILQTSTSLDDLESAGLTSTTNWQASGIVAGDLLRP